MMITVVASFTAGALVLAIASASAAQAASFDLGVLRPGDGGRLVGVVRQGEAPNRGDFTWSFDRAAFGAADPALEITASWRYHDRPGAPASAPDWSHLLGVGQYRLDLSSEPGEIVSNGAGRWVTGAATLRFSEFDRLASVFDAVSSAQGLADMGYWRIDYAVSSTEVSPVPLPAAGWLLGTAVAGLALRRRR